MTAENAQTKDKFLMRLPDGMRDRIAELASANNRSMNAQIVLMISGAMDGTGASRSEVNTASSEIEDLRRQLVTAREAVRDVETLVAARGGAVRFYELSIRTLAQSVLASGAELSGPLAALLREWATYQGMFHDTPPGEPALDRAAESGHHGA